MFSNWSVFRPFILLQEVSKAPRLYILILSYLPIVVKP
jgi:hypothetical protein